MAPGAIATVHTFIEVISTFLLVEIVADETTQHGLPAFFVTTSFSPVYSFAAFQILWGSLLWAAYLKHIANDSAIGV